MNNVSTGKLRDIKIFNMKGIEPYVTDYKNGIDSIWKYRKSKFQPGNIAYLTGEYVKMVDFFFSDPHVKLKDYVRRKAGRTAAFKMRKV